MGAGRLVRHYEDIVRIIDDLRSEPLGELSRLLSEMTEERDIEDWPSLDHLAWDPDAEPGPWEEVEQAWVAIGPMFWGDRVPLAECADEIRRLLHDLAEV